jgi:ssDNA-binding replication factor A large subunit
MPPPSLSAVLCSGEQTSAETKVNSVERFESAQHSERQFGSVARRKFNFEISCGGVGGREGSFQISHGAAGGVAANRTEIQCANETREIVKIEEIEEVTTRQPRWTDVVHSPPVNTNTSAPLPLCCL